MTSQVNGFVCIKTKIPWTTADHYPVKGIIFLSSPQIINSFASPNKKMAYLVGIVMEDGTKKLPFYFSCLPCPQSSVLALSCHYNKHRDQPTWEVKMRQGQDINCQFHTQLEQQWLRRETWCAVTGSIPDIQRRHFPHTWNHTIRLCGAEGPPMRSAVRPVYFPRTRRMFPDLKNASCLSGQF